MFLSNSSEYLKKGTVFIYSELIGHAEPNINNSHAKQMNACKEEETMTLYFCLPRIVTFVSTFFG